MPVSLHELNNADENRFVEMAGFLVENSSWVLEEIAGQRPFGSAQALCDAIEAAITRMNRADQTNLFLAHPELAGAEAQAGTMTRESTGEQGRLGLLSLDRKELERLQKLNAEYRQRFGYPFIVALSRQPDLAAVFGLLAQRLRNDPDAEIRATIAEIMHVVRGRAAQISDDRVISGGL
ncbi:2-oxo-4-hydroxy-4-carboxy-5-ureidoimidazoline decarboxylase [Paracoccus methylarcula]|uniref:2-oxo-4-hydroxy-4-carboxy-5-ureidoimidazoline decarboxylase n=1 Tax=Paracoccus methylarcula TaxID=72022 RepID=A0A3R7LHS2_9RHOB|nr:2-oxo-4-hydroxy-4-carboxy-5-ureidoimidazoline decarboxylase [Paracoccus methylarcula]RNF34344.1 2-oxo-4-hydroxy-4-carboxy-5-ureidoimidazoline decarboxylase [Paracoccus methylarcula]